MNRLIVWIGSTENAVAKAIKVLTIIHFVVCLLAGFLLGQVYPVRDEFNWVLMICIWIAGAVSGLLLMGFAEIVEKLHSINSRI